jgi:hypothetical protein
MDKPRTPDDWQLFTASVSEGGPVTQQALDNAAAALNIALDLAAEAVRAGTAPYEAYARCIEPVAEEHEEMGASDSEPRDIAILYLESIARTRT